MLTPKPKETMSAKIHPPRRDPSSAGATSASLPPLIQTPSGSMLLELQGTINVPELGLHEVAHADASAASAPLQIRTPIGRLEFPDYAPPPVSSTDWMKRVYLYVGQHQRLAGEVKKLSRPVAVIRRRAGGEGDKEKGDEQEVANDLEVLEVVKYKLVFSQRPEPVGTAVAPIAVV